MLSVTPLFDEIRPLLLIIEPLAVIVTPPLSRSDSTALPPVPVSL